MSVIVKTVNQEVLDRAAALLAGIDGGMEKAVNIHHNRKYRKGTDACDRNDYTKYHETKHKTESDLHKSHIHMSCSRNQGKDK